MAGDRSCGAYRHRSSDGKRAKELCWKIEGLTLIKSIGASPTLGKGSFFTTLADANVSPQRAKPESKVYVGVGSQSTPLTICQIMSRLGEKLAIKGAKLRSGAAKGADAAFESGCDRALGLKDIFTAKHWYFREAIKKDVTSLTLYRESEWTEAQKIAALYHPNWANLKPYHRKLHSRNCFQVLGIDLRSPADFLLCWTPDKAKEKTSPKTGGTGQAIRIAVAHGIKVYNLANDDDLAIALQWISA